MMLSDSFFFSPELFIEQERETGSGVGGREKGKRDAHEEIGKEREKKRREMMRISSLEAHS